MTDNVHDLDVTKRTRQWALTMAGHEHELGGDEVVRPHRDSHASIRPGEVIDRITREQREAATLRQGATLAHGAGNRDRTEAPDALRTCFERDKDRIIHSTAFRRLAGKTQVVVYPTDHQRTRLTHAIEVAQVATSIARGVGANVTLAEAIALGHDCGHGPGGHASEEAFDVFLPEGFDHGPWGAHVALADLNLCHETLDGIANHSWSRPAPATIEGEIVSWADRIAYCAHDLEDAIHAGIIRADQVPGTVHEALGVRLSQQLDALIGAVVTTSCRTGAIGMDTSTADALAALRRFNYEHIYTRPESLAQSHIMIRVLQELVSFYFSHQDRLPPDHRDPDDPMLGVVTYVAGMTDRFAFDQAEQLLGWQRGRLPQGVGHGAD
ncbi:Deoxyguanosinetriphosphate triphosphohydrolase (dGTPase) [Propionibacterium freudenreichii]|nr:Deoxyguanosinetriphosphate triphosphohydrolase (dGTPase) [Propionibacterium freudenreichii]SBT29465.1 Putative dGTPase [Propionibacterium freudenreichii]